MKKLINLKTQSVTFTFEGLEPITLGLAGISEDTITHATLHGLSQKIGDNAAISKSEENGWTVTEEMRRGAVMEMMEQLKTVGWNAAARTRKAPQNATFLAIAAKRGCSYEEAEAWVAAKMLEELGA